MNENHEKYISDATNYDSLYQSHYAHGYAYIPVTRRRGRTIDNDSNFTRRALDFPYHQETQLSFYDPGEALDKNMKKEEIKELGLKKVITSIVV